MQRRLTHHIITDRDCHHRQSDATFTRIHERSHLFPHGALVGVPGTLVVVGVGDEPRHNAEQGERIDLEVRVVEGQVAVRKRNEAIVFFVHVHVFHHALLDEVCARGRWDGTGRDGRRDGEGRLSESEEGRGGEGREAQRRGSEQR